MIKDLDMIRVFNKAMLRNQILRASFMIPLLIILNFFFKELIIIVCNLCFGCGLYHLKIQQQSRQMNNLPNINIASNTLAAEWLTPSTKDFIKQRIRNAAKGQIVQTNDNAVAEQYYRMWLEVPVTNPMQRLARNPLLTLEDKQKIDEYVYGQQKQQIKSACMLTGGGLTIYWLFLSRTSFFQNLFNNKERKWIFNVGRKILGVYLVFLGSMVVMNSHYEKKIPNGLNDMGMFKKYRITYQQKFV